MTMRFFLFFAALASLSAQPSMQLVSPATIRPGASSVVSVTLVNPTATLAGAQFTLTLPAAWTWGTVTPGSAAIAASKTIACNPAPGICLAYQINTNALGSGPIAVIPFTVPVTQAPGASPVSLTGLVGADATGAGIAMAAAPAPSTITVLQIEDINADGKVDALDVLIAVNQVLGLQACTGADVNGDGKCDLLDVERVVKAALAAGVTTQVASLQPGK